jgi:hypothetical protein
MPDDKMSQTTHLRQWLSTHLCQWLRHVVVLHAADHMILQVINTAYGITGSICGLMGTLGYLMYGNGVKDVVTFNLPPVSRLTVQ